MPEGDVLLLTAERLGAALRGSELVRAELRWPSAAGVDLVGRALTEAAAYGKHVLLRFDDGRTLHTHLRMDGSWRVHRTGSRDAAARSPAVRAVLATRTWTCVGWRLGMLDVLRTRDEPRLLAHLGPDVLAPGFPSRLGEGVSRLRAEPGRAVCAALLDQRTVAGLGTIWTAEALFACRVWPWTPAGDLDDQALATLLSTARRLMSRSVAVARRAGFGAVEHAVHGRHRRPCRRCATPVALGSTSGPGRRPDGPERVVYWCPSCQRAPAA
ncbi:DNA-formamidopyrimidine glycosylase family protein [Isoptericola sp. BMS4]|uniref:DNA-formamidopyrimidine glycosylase family protein n=1 Tax=Isoptericola sp. BMS4 TaxID=2527875 RepID=UPI0014216963|nr:DNA-formamidopyrimidine glycosylase family protein [Isoptericola sp. BMS4]